MLRYCFAIVLAGLSTGAQAAPPGEFAGVNPKDLQVVSGPKSVVLTDRLFWIRASKNTELGLLPSKYTVNWHDSEGQFFLAEKPAFYMRTVRGQYLLARGGVLMPHVPTAKPRFFFVQDDQVKTGKTLEEAISHTPEEPGFVPLLDALLNWASRGHVVALAEIDDEALTQKLRVWFTVK